jgi:glutathione S-transferase
MTSPALTLFHSPNTRSSGTLVLLEELGARYNLHLLDMKAGEQRAPAFLAINPMGKVPAILHEGVLVTEQVAITLYLADLFPQAGLTPAIGDPRRGAYLRWLVFYASCFEPAVVDQYMKREPAPAATSPYGDFDTMLDILTAQLDAGPYLTGETITAADIQWGMGLAWTTAFGLVPKRPAIMAYVERVTSLPAFAKVRERDAALAAEQDTKRQGS